MDRGSKLDQGRAHSGDVLGPFFPEIVICTRKQVASGYGELPIMEGMIPLSWILSPKKCVQLKKRKKIFGPKIGFLGQNGLPLAHIYIRPKKH